MNNANAISDLRDGAAGGAGLGGGPTWPTFELELAKFIDWTEEGWIIIGLTLVIATGEGAVGINGGDTAGKTVDEEVADNGKLIGGAIPEVIVGGLVRSGEDALGTESKNT